MMDRGTTTPAGGAKPAGPAGAAAGTTRRIVLVGNPNVGKSALFNALTGLRATVSNYPGTTVEIYRGRLAGTDAEVVDSPGLNSLLPLSEDERVTWDLVRSVRGEEGAVVVQVADAKNLRRALLLTLQLGQLEVPTVLVLNMHDEAEARGIGLDLRGLEAALGIPVRTTVATRGLGIEGVTACPRVGARAPEPPAPAGGRGRPGARSPHGPGRAPRERRPPSSPATTSRCWRTPARSRAGTPPTARREGRTSRAASGAWPSTRSGAGPSSPAVLFALYEFVGVFGAGTLVDLMEKGLFHGYLNPWAMALFSHVPWAFARDLVRRRVRPADHGPLLRPRHRPAHRRSPSSPPSRSSRTPATCRASR